MYDKVNKHVLNRKSSTNARRVRNLRALSVLLDGGWSASHMWPNYQFTDCQPLVL